jgi:hypothetical protein
MENCSIDGCTGPIKNKARKLCGKHYARFLRHGDATVVNLRRARTSEDGLSRQCTTCDEWLPLSAFYADRVRRGSVDRRPACKECMCRETRHKWATEPESMKRTRRRHLLKVKYGITLEQYEEMLEAQGGVCKICKQPPGERLLAVDHCHNSLQVRGLLCGRCNTSLERIEIPGWVEAAQAYLRDSEIAMVRMA